MAKMYHREKSIQLKSSASALYNNLSVLRLAPRSLTHFAVVHANVVNLVSASWDGLNYSHRQLQSKEGNVATSSSLIMQVMHTFDFCRLFVVNNPASNCTVFKVLNIVDDGCQGVVL